MKQREVTDSANTRWTCVQAYTMVDRDSAEEISHSTKGESGQITVVCTPSGGAKTVRIELPENWDEVMDDAALLQAIQKNGN